MRLLISHLWKQKSKPSGTKLKMLMEPSANKEPIPSGRKTNIREMKAIRKNKQLHNLQQLIKSFKFLKMAHTRLADSEWKWLAFSCYPHQLIIVPMCCWKDILDCLHRRLRCRNVCRGTTFICKLKWFILQAVKKIKKLLISFSLLFSLKSTISVTFLHPSSHP